MKVTIITKNCYHQMSFLGSNATEMRCRPGAPPQTLLRELAAPPSPLAGWI